MKSNIAYSSDIVREAAKELGMPEEKVAHVLEFLIFYLKKLAAIPECFAIYLPEVGQIYLSGAHLKSLILNLKSKEDKTEKEKDKILLLEERLSSLCNSLETGYSPHLKRSKIRNNYFTLRKSMEELEVFQNGYNEKDN